MLALLMGLLTARPLRAFLYLAPYLLMDIFIYLHYFFLFIYWLVINNWGRGGRRGGSPLPYK